MVLINRELIAYTDKIKRIGNKNRIQNNDLQYLRSKAILSYFVQFLKSKNIKNNIDFEFLDTA